MRAFLNWMDKVSAKAAPACITLFMALLAIALGHIPGLAPLMPALVVINIYFWCVFYPGSLPYAFLFALGLVQDSLTGRPLGFSSLLYMATAIVLVNRFTLPAALSFSGLYIRFALTLTIISMCEWFFMSLYYGKAMPLGEQSIGWLATCLAYPAMHLALVRICTHIHE